MGGCEKPQYQGDGNCDDKNNVAGCEYDGGDCCAKSVTKNGVKTGKVKTNFCTECKCLDPNNQGEAEPAGCAKDNYKGDGNCDDDNNVAGCDYDGGDCCASTVMKNGEKTGKVKTPFCTECKCLDPNNQSEAETTVCSKPGWKGDGNCDDDNNVAACDYDGGDCCASTVMKNGVKTGKVKTPFCDECKCLDPAA